MKINISCENRQGGKKMLIQKWFVPIVLWHIANQPCLNTTTKPSIVCMFHKKIKNYIPIEISMEK